MGGKTVRRVAKRLQGSVNDKVGGGTVNKVCVYWLSGRCTRNPCRFLHLESPTSKPSKQSQDRRSNTWHRSPSNSVKNSSTSHGGGFETESKIARKTQSTAVTGIAFPSGSDKLLTGCKDKTVRVWDGTTGQCVGGVNMSGEVGSLICHDPWVFVGLTNAVKAWNIQTQEELNLTGPVGQVYALTLKKGVLFAGTQVWESDTFECIHTLNGHTDVVMFVGLWGEVLADLTRPWSLYSDCASTEQVWAPTEDIFFENDMCSSPNGFPQCFMAFSVVFPSVYGLGGAYDWLGDRCQPSWDLSL
ncbi:zinc finger WD40 repeat protein 1 [Actinidia rufa]|uniref:Zinc finger WD40 repeat protein 1 n=1 Tax=Actinidia rufa TaxID=165716 RepID=A0A7J0FLV8_9ERIC|nr:zinc finger WD40 repeat protein 1 [Actinidia rufa]